MTKSREHRRELLGINKFIFDNISSDQEIKRRFGLANNMSDIKAFLVEPNFGKRRELAISISKMSLERHGKQDIDPFVNKLAEIESGVQRYNRELRDHINHSVYVYLLGLLFIQKIGLVEILDPLSWKITSLLHDIGYPLQLFSASLKEYLNLVHEYRLRVSGLNVPINYSASITGLENLKFSDENAFLTIERRLEKWNISLDLQTIFDKHQSLGEINHGVLSAMIVLGIIDSLYAEKNPERASSKEVDGIDWGKSCFDTQILDAVSAICLHDVLDELDQIHFENSPIAYLLVLCDALQQWNRYAPKLGIYNPMSVEIVIFQDNIVCKLALPPSRFREIQKTVRDKIQSHVFHISVEGV